MLALNTKHKRYTGVDHFGLPYRCIAGKQLPWSSISDRIVEKIDLQSLSTWKQQPNVKASAFPKSMLLLLPKHFPSNGALPRILLNVALNWGWGREWGSNIVETHFEEGFSDLKLPILSWIVGTGLVLASTFPQGINVNSVGWRGGQSLCPHCSEGRWWWQ